MGVKYNILMVQKCLTQAFEDEDKDGAGALPKQQCLAAVRSLTGDMLQLNPQVCSSQVLVEGDAKLATSSRQHMCIVI